jgi:hypothetical protein
VEAFCEPALTRPSAFAKATADKSGTLSHPMGEGWGEGHRAKFMAREQFQKEQETFHEPAPSWRRLATCCIADWQSAAQQTTSLRYTALPGSRSQCAPNLPGIGASMTLPWPGVRVAFVSCWLHLTSRC